MNNATQSLPRQLYDMTMPMIIGVLAIMSYQLVDSAFIGQLGVHPLAVVGFTIPVYQLVIGFQVGIGIATTAVISRALGSHENEQARQLGTMVLIIGFSVILLICLLLWFNRHVILSLLGAEEHLWPLIETYWKPWLVSAWLGAGLYFGYSIFRANGYTKMPGTVMVITSIINVILDPLFIFVFDMGIAGAAWATICAFASGCLLIYPKIILNRWISRSIDFQQIKVWIKRLIEIMLPALMSQFIPPISAMTATAIVAGFGETVIAAWGLGTRIEFLSIIVVLALTMSLPPMIGRLRGSGEMKQIEQLVRLAVGFVIGWQLIIAIVVLAAAAPIGSLLTNNAEVAITLQGYLWRVPFSYGALGTTMIMVSVANAMGMPLRALSISALRLLCCYLPCLWLGSQLGALTGMFFGAMIGNFAAGIISWRLYRNGLAMLEKQLRPAVD